MTCRWRLDGDPTPECRGQVRRYMNGPRCEVHAPWAIAGHPDPARPDGHWCRNPRCRQPVPQWWVNGPQWQATGACLRCHRNYLPAQELAEEARDRQMARAEAAAPATWKDQARKAIWHLANTRPTFTTDDVWDVLQMWGVPDPPEPRALGPLVFKALRSGAIRDTGRMARSERRHSTKITVYERTPK